MNNPNSVTQGYVLMVISIKAPTLVTNQASVNVVPSNFS